MKQITLKIGIAVLLVAATCEVAVAEPLSAAIATVFTGFGFSAATATAIGAAFTNVLIGTRLSGRSGLMRKR